jgi:glycosyltransferase involved in cell wall biosynthesis
MKQVGVYLDGLSINFRPRNFDWTYVEKKIPRIAEWVPDIRFVQQKSRLVALQANCKTVYMSVVRRLRMPVSTRVSITSRLDAGELARSGCRVVYSQRALPLNCKDFPVIWMHAVVDPEMTMSYFGMSQAESDEFAAAKVDLFRKATVVQVCTEAEAERHRRSYPDIADRFVPVPLFAPYLRSAPESILEKHRKASPVRLLFVGNDARRKGLQETLSAYMALPESVRRATTFTIISHFDGGKVTVPDDPSITVHHGLAQADVIEYMRTSQVLVNVAHHESYGLIFPEAMSQGTLCIGPDWEVQRELFDQGRAGINVRCQVSLIRAVLLRAIEDEEYRLRLATSAWHRFNKLYAPAVVAEKYADLFRSVAARTD